MPYSERAYFEGDHCALVWTYQQRKECNMTKQFNKTVIASQALSDVCDRLRNRAIANGLAKLATGERPLLSERHHLRKAGLLG